MYVERRFVASQLRQLALSVAGIFVAVCWSQAIGELLEVVFARDGQLERIAVTVSVCVLAYALTVAFLVYRDRAGDADGPLVFAAALGGVVAISFRDAIEECVGAYDLRRLLLHRVDRGHGVGAAEADLPTAAVVLTIGTALVILAHRLRKAGTPLAHALGEIELSTLALCSGWVLDDALFRLLLLHVPTQSHGWACALALVLACTLASRAVRVLGGCVHRRSTPSPALAELEAAHGRTWAYAVGIGLVYLLSRFHALDETRYGRAASAGAITLAALLSSLVAARELRVCARTEAKTLEGLVRTLPHVRWPPPLSAWVQRRGSAAATAPGPPGGRAQPPAANTPAGAAARCARACSCARPAVEKLTLEDGSEAALLSRDAEFTQTVAMLRAQPAGAFVVYLGTLQKVPEVSEHALALVRTTLAGEGDVMMVPLVRQAGTNRWSTQATCARAERAQLGALALAIACGWAWQIAADHALNLLKFGPHGVLVAVCSKGALALLCMVALVQLCVHSGWHRDAYGRGAAAGGAQTADGWQRFLETVDEEEAAAEEGGARQWQAGREDVELSLRARGAAAAGAAAAGASAAAVAVRAAPGAAAAEPRAAALPPLPVTVSSGSQQSPTDVVVAEVAAHVPAYTPAAAPPSYTGSSAAAEPSPPSTTTPPPPPALAEPSDSARKGEDDDDHDKDHYDKDAHNEADDDDDNDSRCSDTTAEPGKNSLSCSRQDTAAAAESNDESELPHGALARAPAVTPPLADEFDDDDEADHKDAHELALEDDDDYRAGEIPDDDDDTDLAASLSAEAATRERMETLLAREREAARLSVEDARGGHA